MPFSSLAIGAAAMAALAPELDGTTKKVVVGILIGIAICLLV